MSSISEEAYAAMLERLPPATHTPATCAHEAFAASTTIARLEDTGRFICELRVCCVQCREAFRFMGMKAGLSFERPAVSIDGVEANLPIEPEGEKQLFTSASYEMPHIPTRH